MLSTTGAWVTPAKEARVVSISPTPEYSMGASEKEKTIKALKEEVGRLQNINRDGERKSLMIGNYRQAAMAVDALSNRITYSEFES